jgi:uracil-DNA glycosylase
MKTPKSFTQAIAAMSLPSTFNPYRDCCPIYDRADAAKVRKRNLMFCLEAAIEAKVDTMWIARDLGYRGGRRTGVALTDEVHLAEAALLYGGAALGRATKGPLVAERTAAVVWGLLTQIRQPVMLWNVFPFHPHEADDPLSNRCHTRAEREATWPLLLALIEMLRPKRIVAIGKDAAAALEGIDIPVSTVRHPSYGGQAEFIAGVEQIYGFASQRKPARTAELELPIVYAGTAATAA